MLTDRGCPLVAVWDRHRVMDKKVAQVCPVVDRAELLPCHRSQEVQERREVVLELVVLGLEVETLVAAKTKAM